MNKERKVISIFMNTWLPENAALECLSILRERHFIDPVNGLIFETIRTLVMTDGKVVSPYAILCYTFWEIPEPDRIAHREYLEELFGVIMRHEWYIRYSYPNSIIRVNYPLLLVRHLRTLTREILIRERIHMLESSTSGQV